MGEYMVFGSIVGSDYYLLKYIICPPVYMGECMVFGFHRGF